jgi:CDP-glycerol glycerophosphotransferase (TagB/SpsB family)
VGLIYFLTSKYFFYSFGKYPIKPSQKQIVINLWHGSPLKKIGNFEEGKHDNNYNFFTSIIATSELFKNIMVEAFNCKLEQVIICGQPRNDLLFYSKFIKNKDKLIVWLPTFRYSAIIEEDNYTNGNKLPIFTDDIKLNKLNKFLKINNIQLIIKFHPLQDLRKIEFAKYDNIDIWSELDLAKKQLNLYEILGNSDALITDYSSVFFDYLLLDKQIGFTVDDIDLYSQKRGFVFDNPEDLMPGLKIKNEKDFYVFINNVINNNDYYASDRKYVNDICNYYKDNYNCNRILTLVGIKTNVT